MSALNQRIEPPGRVEPFRPLLYDRRFDGELASMVAPPYDLIGPERQAQLYGRSPFNVVRLELNRDPDRYESSARLLADWLREGVLVRADQPAIYLYKQKFRHQGRTLGRTGLVARFRLEEFGHGRILPHERTFPAARMDRLRLLEATRTNLSSIFGLYSGAHRELDLLRTNVARRAPIRQVTDDLGIDNELLGDRGAGRDRGRAARARFVPRADRRRAPSLRNRARISAPDARRRGQPRRVQALRLRHDDAGRV